MKLRIFPCTTSCLCGMSTEIILNSLKANLPLPVSCCKFRAFTAPPPSHFSYTIHHPISLPLPPPSSLMRLSSCSMSINFNTLNSRLVKHQKCYLKASKATSNQMWCLTHFFGENINFPAAKLWLNELRIGKHCFSMSFSDGFYTTNGSLSVVKQDERKPSFFWSKIVLDAFGKNLRKSKFWQERKKVQYPTPSLLFWI